MNISVNNNRSNVGIENKGLTNGVCDSLKDVVYKVAKYLHIIQDCMQFKNGLVEKSYCFCLQNSDKVNRKVLNKYYNALLKACGKGYVLELDMLDGLLESMRAFSATHPKESDKEIMANMIMGTFYHMIADGELVF